MGIFATSTFYPSLEYDDCFAVFSMVHKSDMIIHFFNCLTIMIFCCALFTRLMISTTSQHQRWCASTSTLEASTSPTRIACGRLRTWPMSPPLTPWPPPACLLSASVSWDTLPSSACRIPSELNCIATRSISFCRHQLVLHQTKLWQTVCYFGLS